MMRLPPRLFPRFFISIITSSAIVSSPLKKDSGQEIIGNKYPHGRKDHGHGRGAPHALGPAAGGKAFITANHGNNGAKKEGFNESAENISKVDHLPGPVQKNRGRDAEFGGRHE